MDWALPNEATIHCVLEATDFDPDRFWPSFFRLRPDRFWPRPILAQNDKGPGRLRPNSGPPPPKKRSKIEKQKLKKKNKKQLKKNKKKKLKGAIKKVRFSVKASPCRLSGFNRRLFVASPAEGQRGSTWKFVEGRKKGV